MPARRLDLLEASGLLRRNKDCEDLCAYRLELTEKAMQECRAIADAVEAPVLSARSYLRAKITQKSDVPFPGWFDWCQAWNVLESYHSVLSNPTMNPKALYG